MRADLARHFNMTWSQAGAMTYGDIRALTEHLAAETSPAEGTPTAARQLPAGAQFNPH